MTESVGTRARLRVIYGDTDQMGVVYYANYFRYFEFARGELFRALGGSYLEFEKQGLGLPVVEASCNYRSPAKYDDILEIDIQVADVRRASMRFAYQVRRESSDVLLSEGHTVHACVGPDGKPTGLPKAVVRLLKVGAPKTP